MSGLPPVLYHFFTHPVPYASALNLQQFIHQRQLARRRRSLSLSPAPSPASYDSSRERAADYLLLLEHRPVYTAGRRQLEEHVCDERTRLQRMGADFVRTQRGGELTYHGPGQLVGYPLIDLAHAGASSAAAGANEAKAPAMAMAMPIRDYVCRLQRLLQAHLRDTHGIAHAPSEHTGVFLLERDAHEDAIAGRSATKTGTKIASIGVQVAHRLTLHGFALNVTREPLPWFDTVVACGLADVKAGCIAGRSRKSHTTTTAAAAAQHGDDDDVSVAAQIAGVVEQFGRAFGREMVELDVGRGTADDVDDDVCRAIRAVEEEAALLEQTRPPLRAPRL